jgi:hypothetical protein
MELNATEPVVGPLAEKEIRSHASPDINIGKSLNIGLLKGSFSETGPFEFGYLNPIIFIVPLNTKWKF